MPIHLRDVKSIEFILIIEPDECLVHKFGNVCPYLGMKTCDIPRCNEPRRVFLNELFRLGKGRKFWFRAFPPNLNEKALFARGRAFSIDHSIQLKRGLREFSPSTLLMFAPLFRFKIGRSHSIVFLENRIRQLTGSHSVDSTITHGFTAVTGSSVGVGSFGDMLILPNSNRWLRDCPFS